MSSLMAYDINQIDQLIRQGKQQRAWQILNEIRLVDIARDDLVTFSDFGVRIKRPKYSLAVLSRQMKKHLEKITEARPLEIIAYTKALIKMGLFLEAERWLRKIDQEHQLEVHNLKGRLFLSQWNYRKSTFHMKKYLQGLLPNSYGALVASLNLGAGLIYLKKYDEAIDLLSHTESVAKHQGHRIIAVNTNELLGQAHILSGRQAKGKAYIEASMVLLGKEKNVYHFYGRKWHCLADFLEKGDKETFLVIKNKLRQEALAAEYWEDVRDLDRRHAYLLQDHQVALKLFFGTYYESYKKDIHRECLQGIEIPNHYLWQIQEDSSGPLTDMSETLKTLEKPRLLFDALTTDHYRPLATGHLFSVLYPDEFFDPFSSPSRLYRNIRRLRKKMPDGITIAVNQNGAFIKALKPMAFDLKIKERLQSNEEHRFQELRCEMKRRWFTTDEVCNLFAMSPRSSQRLIKKISERYKVERAGRGKSQRYRFAG